MIRYDCNTLSNIDVFKNKVYFATSDYLQIVDLDTYKKSFSYWDIPMPMHLCINDQYVAISLKKSVLLLEGNRERKLKIASTKIQWNQSNLCGVGRHFWVYDTKGDTMTTVRTLNHQGTNIAFNDNYQLAISTVKGVLVYDTRQLMKPLFNKSQYGIQDISWQSDNSLTVGCSDSIFTLSSTFEVEHTIDSDCYKLIPHSEYILNVPLSDRSCVQVFSKSAFITDFYPTDDLIMDAVYNEYSNTIISSTDGRQLEITNIPQMVQSRTNMKTKVRIRTELNGYPTTLVEEVYSCTQSIKNMHSILLDFSENIFIFEVTAGNSFLVTIRLRVPCGYPKSGPIQPLVESNKFGDLQTDLIQISKSFFVKGKRCMRDILEYIKQYPSRKLTSPDEPVVVETLQDSQDNVPFPALVGVAFSPRGMAVFFSPIYLEKPTDKVESAFVFRIGLQSHPRNYEMFKQFKAVAFKYLKESPKLLSPYATMPTMSITLIEDIPGFLPSSLLQALDFNVTDFNSFYLANASIVEQMKNDMSSFIWSSFQSASKLIERHFCPNALFSLLQQSVYRIIQKDDILLAALLAGGIALLLNQNNEQLPLKVPILNLKIQKTLEYLKTVKSLVPVKSEPNKKILLLLNVINPLVHRFIQLLNKFEMHTKKVEFLKILRLPIEEKPFQSSTNTYCHTCKTLIMTKRCEKCHFNSTTLCGICQNPVESLAYFCTKCNHGGHVDHIFEWFKTKSVCASGCGCNCLF